MCCGAPGPIEQRSSKEAAPLQIDVYDPEMCCSTGVCGPSPDPELIRVNTLLNRLRTEGHTVNRYMLSRNPLAFSSNRDVYKALLDKGVKALPIVCVDGRVVGAGAYPADEHLIGAGSVAALQPGCG